MRLASDCCQVPFLTIVTCDFCFRNKYSIATPKLPIMAAAMPLVVQGESICHDTLFVSLGEYIQRSRAFNRRSDRASHGSAPKDQVAHWYEAQPIQHSLARPKDRTTAKVRLLGALNKDDLPVPPHLVNMAAQMKKEYAATVCKAKAEAPKQSTAEKNTSKPSVAKVSKTQAAR